MFGSRGRGTPILPSGAPLSPLYRSVEAPGVFPLHRSGEGQGAGPRGRVALPRAGLLDVLLLMFLLSSLLAACVPASAPRTIKLGLVAPFSGRDAALGYNMLVAARLAVKEWNDRGGVGGYYIELVAQDDRSEADAGATQPRKMALDPQMMGVIGHPSPESAQAAARVYRQEGLPAIITGAGLSAEELGGPPVFLLGATRAVMASEASRFILSRHTRELAVVYDGRPGLGSRVGDAAGRSGLKVTFIGRITADSGNEAPLGPLMQTSPDLVFYDGGYVDGASLLKGLEERDVDTAFLGGPGLAHPDLLKLAGSAAEGAYYMSTAPAPAGMEEARDFVDTYRAAAGTDPWPRSLLAYDAINTMLEGLDRAARAGRKPGRAALRQSLAAGEYRGVSGPIAFNDQGEQASARGYIYHIERMAWPGRLMAE